MTTTPTPRSLAVKVRRTVWREEDHPRDRKGRFIETGAEVRVWGGWLGRVIRNVGGGRIEVARDSDKRLFIVHRNYLTVTARPDGSAPTDLQAARPADLPEQAASPEAEVLDLAPPAPEVTPTAPAGDLHSTLTDLGDTYLADLARRAAADYVEALNNGTPDDEADERDGLLGVLHDIALAHPSTREQIELVREAATAEPPAPEPDVDPVDAAFDAAEVEATEAGDAMAAMAVGMARTQHVSGNREGAAQALAIAAVSGRPLAVNAQRVYAESNERSADEQVRGPGGSPLEGTQAEGVRVDPGQGDVLRGTGGGSRPADQRDGGGPQGPDTGRGDVPGPDEPVSGGPVDRGVGGVPGGAPTTGGDDAGADRPSGRAVRDSGEGVPGVEGPGDGAGRDDLTRGQVVYWQNPDPDDFVTTLRGTFSHYGDDPGSAYIDVRNYSGARNAAPTIRRQVNVTDLHPADDENPSAAEVEWRGRNEPGYQAPTTDDRRTFTVDGVEYIATVTPNLGVGDAGPFEGEEWQATVVRADGTRVGDYFGSTPEDAVEQARFQQDDSWKRDAIAADVDALRDEGFVEVSADEVAAQVAAIRAAADVEAAGAERVTHRTLDDGSRVVEDPFRNPDQRWALLGPDGEELSRGPRERVEARADRLAEVLAEYPDDPTSDSAPPDAMDAEAAGDYWVRGRALRRLAREYGITYAEADERFGSQLETTGQSNVVTGASVRALLRSEADLTAEYPDAPTPDDGMEQWAQAVEAAGTAADALAADERRGYDTGYQAAREGEHSVDYVVGQYDDESYVHERGIRRGFAAYEADAAQDAGANAATDPVGALLATERTEDTAVGPVSSLGPRVGSWRTRVDPSANEGRIVIEGDYGIRGEMRFTLNGWLGSLGKPGDDNLTVVDVDPQVVLDRLFDDVNGEGAAARTRREVEAGRPAAPEVGLSWDDLEEGARIRITPHDVSYDYRSGGYKVTPLSDDSMDVEFIRTSVSTYGTRYRHVWYRDPETGEETQTAVPGDAGLVPAAPVLGEGADDDDLVAVTDADDDRDYTPDPYAVPVLDRDAPAFNPTGIDDFAPNGVMAKADANIAALQVLKTLRAQNRPAAAEEQAVLARWSGWGGVAGIFDEGKPEFASRREVLKTLLDPTEYRRARRTTVNAHYTDPRAVEAIWQAVEDLGVTGGRVIEPGSGSGTFIGYAPDGVDMVGVEWDSTTAAISKYLYPGADIRAESYGDTTVPPDAFDGAVGNVPFGKYPIPDPEYNPNNEESIHNHFINKTLRLTRPGGIVALLTSRYTLDSLDKKSRERMYERADLIGAVRLPNGAHKRIAETDVIEDLLIFRVRGEGETPGDDSWVKSTKRDLNGWNVAVNGYFDKNPGHVLGTLTARKGQYGGEVAVEGDPDMGNLPSVLAGITVAARENGLTATDRPDDTPLPSLVAANSGRYEGHIRREEDGSFTIATRGAEVPFEVPVKHRDELGALLGVRDAFLAVLNAETASAEDSEDLAGLRQTLNDRYDAYVAVYGPLNRFTYTKSGARRRPTLGGFREDPKAAVVMALENYEPPNRVTGAPQSASKAAIFTTRSVAPRELRTTADTPADALTLSIEQFGRVNMPAIADMLGTDETTARERLGNLVFEEPPLTEDEQLAAEQAAARLRENPDAVDLADLGIGTETLREPGNLVPAAEYLSGNVRKKLAAARVAAEADPRYQANVEALKPVIPAELGPEEIQVSLGAAWIDTKTIEDFVNDITGRTGYQYNKPTKRFRVAHSGGGIWRIEAPPRDQYNNREDEWGTSGKGGKRVHWILQRVLEQRPIKITGQGVDSAEASLAAQEKAEQLQERFREWLWEDPDRSRRMIARYNDQFNAIALRKYDGQARQFPGMSDDWAGKVLPHVKDAVERIVNEPTALLAHVVGAGKTAEMVMGTQELKRLGLARKPAIIVPNHMLAQMTREYLEIYPSAKILTAGQGMSAEERRTFVARAAAGDWDAVIMTQGAFKGIPMSADNIQRYIDTELAEMRTQLALMQAEAEESGNKAQKRTVKQMETKLLEAEAGLKKKLNKVKDLGVSWEQTGIDYLMVDEAHQYSNLRTLSNIQGAGASGSDMASDLHMKLGHLRETTRTGRVATFATGTPIRNTITQAYMMIRYLRPDLLAESGIHSFDQWAATFGSVVEAMELKPEGKGFRSKQRFAEFRNVPEFLRMFHTFADVKMRDDLTLRTPSIAGGKAQVIAVPSSAALRAYVNELGERAEDVRSGKVDPTEDNMLKISTDGRKAALSMALVETAPGVFGDHEPGKLEAAADRIASIHDSTKDTVYRNPKTGDPEGEPGSLQIVFMDMGTPKGGKNTDEDDDEDDKNDRGGDIDASGSSFVAYDHLKAELVARGIPAEKIRYIHEAKNDAEKAELFAAAKTGAISVLIGSSEKMGVGTNMQRRAKALHHIDAPWRPADVEQREGRIDRQGNLHRDMGEDIEIYRYVTEQSFDAYMWQTLERKARFINQVMKGTLDVREIEDVGDTALNYAEVKAIATGKPDYLALATGETLIAKLARLQRTHAKAQTNMRFEMERLGDLVRQYEAHIPQLAALVEKTRMPEAFTMNVNGEDFVDRVDAGAKLQERLMEVRQRNLYGRDTDPVDVATFAGHTVTAETTYNGISGEREVILRLAGSDAEVTRVGLHSLKPGQGAQLGLIARISNYVDALETRTGKLTAAAADARAELARMQGKFGGDFPRQHELEAWTKKVERLRAKITRDDARDEGSIIPFEPTIDSDEFDDPITKGSAVTNAPPPEPQPRTMTVSAQALAVGDRVEYVKGEVTGTRAEGRVVSKREAAGMVFVTILGDDGVEVMRAFDITTEVTKVGDTTAPTGVKGVRPLRLDLVDGQVVVTEVKRFQEELHPRDRNGRFIEKFATVKIWGGGTGKVTRMLRGGRVEVARDDGSTVVVDAGNVTVTKKPDAPGAPGAAAGAISDGADTTQPPVDRTGVTMPTTDRQGRRPAPGATPDTAVATFTGDNGERAWLDTSTGKPVGYMQMPGEDPEEFTDADAWAQAVDSAGLAPDAGSESAQDAADGGGPPEGDGDAVGGDADDRRSFTAGGVEYLAILREDPNADDPSEAWTATTYGPDDAPGDPAAVGYGATPDEAVAQAESELSPGTPEPDGKGPRVPASEYGMTYSEEAANDPAVQFAKTWEGWDDLPLVDVPLEGLTATEETLSRKPIDRVVNGGEPLREGYDPFVLIRADGSAVVIDGHHRVAMHGGLGSDTMPARVYDERELGPITEADTSAVQYDDAAMRERQRQEAGEADARDLAATQDRNRRQSTPNPDFDPDARAGTSESFENVEDDDLNFPRTRSDYSGPRYADDPGNGAQTAAEIRAQAAQADVEALAELGEQAARDLDLLEANHGNQGRIDGAGTIDDPIDVQGDIDRAAQLLTEGKHVRLNRVDELGTLVDQLNAMVDAAKEAGERGPDFDLCNVSVPGTNLFCSKNKGIERDLMPQLSGVPREGSRAADLPRSSRGEVDATEEFLAELHKRGIAVQDVEVPAAWLKATQTTLVGPKVAGITRAMQKGTLPDAQIFVTRDGYVIDGHHRWAAKVNVDAGDGKLGDTLQPVRMVDMEIGEALAFSKAFQADVGIMPKGSGANADAVGGAPADAPAAVPGSNPLDTTLSDRTDEQLARALETVPAADMQANIRQELLNRAQVKAQSLADQAKALEPEMTTLMQSIEREFDGKLEGLDNNRKGMKRMTEKITDKAIQARREQRITDIGDALRYTIVMDTNSYGEGTKAMLDRFASEGFEVKSAGNMWVAGNNYKGLNVVLINDAGFQIEVQTHTPESFAAKMDTHADYEISRDITQPMAERQAAHFRMVALQEERVPIPSGVDDIGERWVTNAPLFSPPDRLPAPPVPGSEGYAATQAQEALAAGTTG